MPFVERANKKRRRLVHETGRNKSKSRASSNPAGY